MLLPRQLGVETNAVFEQFSRIQRLAVQLQMARLERGEVQGVVDHLQHELTRTPDVGKESELFFPENGGRLVAQKLSNGYDTADRVSQVVRGHAEKLSLEPVEAFKFRRCLFQGSNIRGRASHTYDN